MKSLVYAVKSKPVHIRNDKPYFMRDVTRKATKVKMKVKVKLSLCFFNLAPHDEGVLGS